MDRIEKIKANIPKKMFFDPSFEAPSKKALLAEVKLGDKAVLSPEQEYRIFRKYNYLKYKMLKLTVGFKSSNETPSPKPCPPRFNLERIGEKSICQMERLIGQISETRNFIIKANIGLVFRPVARHISSDSFERDELLSNAHMHVLKTIECFDYRRGFKFSTYCVHAIKMNLLRDMENLIKAKAPLEFFESLSSASYGEELESAKEDREYSVQMVERVLDKVRMSRNRPDEKIEILKGYYGLGGTKPMLLRELGAKMNMSHERVRQIKLEALWEAKCLTYDP